MATHSTIPAWDIPWAEEPGRLHFMRLPRRLSQARLSNKTMATTTNAFPLWWPLWWAHLEPFSEDFITQMLGMSLERVASSCRECQTALGQPTWWTWCISTQPFHLYWHYAKGIPAPELSVQLAKSFIWPHLLPLPPSSMTLLPHAP